MSGDYSKNLSLSFPDSKRNDGYSKITITNDTNYTLTIRYSGAKDSEKAIISTKQTKSIKVLNGYYTVTASVNAGSVDNYVGHENLQNGNYSISYYIKYSFNY